MTRHCSNGQECNRNSSSTPLGDAGGTNLIRRSIIATPPTQKDLLSRESDGASWTLPRRPASYNISAYHIRNKAAAAEQARVLSLPSPRSGRQNTETTIHKTPVDTKTHKPRTRPALFLLKGSTQHPTDRFNRPHQFSRDDRTVSYDQFILEFSATHLISWR
ncbi:unnamed protein product [Ectocarpus sp. 12 AP-2014]